MMEAYKTIQGTAQARIEEKKSEFIAHAAFADTEEKALAFLNGIRAKHRTANHNVYAYILRDGARMRYSDDGEPGRFGKHRGYLRDMRRNEPTPEEREIEEMKQAARVIKEICDRRTADDACSFCPFYDMCRTEPYTWEV